MNKKILQSERGFTLIEVIAVLIIIGILAAVAIPRYFDLADDARKKAYNNALAEGMSLCSLAYGKAALEKAGKPDESDVFKALTGQTTSPYTIDPASVAPASGLNIEGDFKYTFAIVTGTGIKIDIFTIKWDTADDTTANLLTKTWYLP